MGKEDVEGLREEVDGFAASCEVGEVGEESCEVDCGWGGGFEVRRGRGGLELTGRCGELAGLLVGRVGCREIRRVGRVWLFRVWSWVLVMEIRLGGWHMWMSKQMMNWLPWLLAVLSRQRA